MPWSIVPPAWRPVMWLLFRASSIHCCGARPAGGVVVTSQWNPSNIIGNVVSVSVQMTYTHGLPYISPNGLVVQVTSQGVILH